MPKFGKQSLERLATCHPDIQRVMNEVIKRYDITVIYGARNVDEQYALYKQGRQLVNGVWKVIDPKKVVTNLDGRVKKSKHNHTPSLAIDIAPYPIDWNDTARFIAMKDIVMEEADKLGVKLTWGGTFKSVDMPHFELKG